jgi:transmembrane sensor
MAAMDDSGSRHGATAEQAAYWFARLRAEDCSEREKRSFEDWLAESDTHRREYERVRLMWEEMDGLKAELGEAVSAAPFRRWIPSLAWLPLTAAAAMVAVGMGWLSPGGTTVYSYSTVKGEQRSVALPDGSVVQLATDTLLKVEISADSRKVRLEKGEALFTVVHEERPFEVEAGEGVIRDIGTRFDVRRDEGRVAVAVLDGAVEIRLARGANGDTGGNLVLSKGQLAQYSNSRLSAAAPFDEEAITAWRSGKLVFDGTPLAEVVRELKRYHDRRVVIADRTLGALKVSGVFNAGDLDGLLLALQQVLPLQADSVGNTTILSRSVATTSPRLRQTF